MAPDKGVRFSPSALLLNIAGGNTTALIWDCPEKCKNPLARKYLKLAEQVGFISGYRNLPKLTMAGGELCINATLALASQLKKRGVLLTSGIKGPVNYTNSRGFTTIKIPLAYRIKRDIVLFNGIGFVCFNKYRKVTKEFLSNLARRYGLPAFGAIIREKNKIIPYVYVKKVNSFFRESACGSASIATNLITSISRIKQPSGGIISIKKAKIIEVKARVTTLSKETIKYCLKDKNLRKRK